MDREWLIKQWSESNTTGLWHAPWSKAVDGLTPQQAAWKPGPDRHSIWQIVHHMILWRESALPGWKKPPPQEIDRRNWEEPTAITASAWRQTVKRFTELHEQIGQAIADSRNPLDRLQYLVAHDSYHIGQVMHLRALQGLELID